MLCPKCKQDTLHKDGKTPAGKQRYTCGGKESGEYVHCYTTTNPKLYRGQNGKVKGLQIFKRDIEQKPEMTYIFTAAQNNTPVHRGFLASLKRAARHYKAELVVLAYRYRNPTTSKENTKSADNEWWANELTKYLWNVRLRVNSNLIVLGDVPVQSTATNPLESLEGFTGTDSTIQPHPRLELKTVATPSSRMAKLMTTTGACTRDTNYSLSKAGKKGEFHHTLGAVLVQVKGKEFRIRHLIADKAGCFNDYDMRFTPTGKSLAPPPLAIICGDSHERTKDPLVDAARFGPEGVVTWLKPRNIVFHDVDDGSTHNHHERKNPFVQVAKAKGGEATRSIRREVVEAIGYVNDRTPLWAKSWVVPSNHDNFLTRHIIDEDWKKDPDNAEFYLETALEMVRSAEWTVEGAAFANAFRYWGRKLGSARTTFLGAEDKLSFAGIVCHLHGDKGPDGAQGSVQNLSKMGNKGVSAHNHTPTIIGGWWSAGTGSVLRPTYTHGSPSSWMQADVIIHSNAKRQFVFYIDGKYRI